MFTVSLSTASKRAVTVYVQSTNATTSPATAKVDSVPLGNTLLTFAPGQRNQKVSIIINGDSLDEDDERVGLLLSSPKGAVLGTTLGEGSILDDDATPSLSINNTSVREGNSGTTKATFTVKLSAPSGRTVNVGYNTQSDGNDAATPDMDYLRAGGSIFFSPGQTSKTFTVLVKGDTVVEANEFCLVYLSMQSNVTLDAGIGMGTILNDDKAFKSADSPRNGFGSGGNS